MYANANAPPIIDSAHTGTHSDYVTAQKIVPRRFRIRTTTRICVI